MTESACPTNDQPGIPRAIHLRAWAAFGAITLVFVVLFYWGRDMNIWANWQEARGLYNSSYQERVYVESIFRTRANTWSNLAYVLAGLYAVFFALRDWPDRKAPGNYLQHHPAMGLAFGLACILLGLGSGLYHASLTKWGQHLDVAAMYPPLMMLIAIGLGRQIRHIGPLPTWPLMLMVVAAAGIYLYIYKWQMSAQNVLATLLILVCALRLIEFFRKAPMKTRYFHLGFACLVIGVFFRQMDVANRFTGPDAWLQGHALWHCFTAASLGAIYAYYRSEPPTPTKNGGQ